MKNQKINNIKYLNDFGRKYLLLNIKKGVSIAPSKVGKLISIESFEKSITDWNGRKNKYILMRFDIINYEIDFSL